jgi:hypothetical protein
MVGQGGASIIAGEWAGQDPAAALAWTSGLGSGRGQWKRAVEEGSGRGQWKRAVEEGSGRGQWKRAVEEGKS